MVLTHCMMGWMVLAVLSLCLPVWSAVKVIQPYRVVSNDGTAQVQCFIQPRLASYNQIQHSYNQSPSYPYPGPKDLRVTLLKGLHGSQELCSSIVNVKEQRETGVEKDGEVQCSAVVIDGAVEVTVSGLKASDTDMYRCEIEVFFPPPYLRLTGNGTLIHVADSLPPSDCPVQGAQRQIAQQDDEEEDEESNKKMESVSVPVVVLIILVMSVLFVIIFFQTLQCKPGRREIVRPVPVVPHKVDAATFSCVNIA